ncbi:MAG: SDR family NAD(P)-dependent oxidoreductase [Candidatus Heimdallarchaeaceae archaeon]
MEKKAKTILVTGAANGIGLAITNYLAKKGDKLIGTDIDTNGLEKLKKKGNIVTIEMNVRDIESIRKAKEEIEKIEDALDGLVNNAGVFIGGPLVELEEEELKKILETNVLGMALVTKEFFNLLFKKKGRIVNMSSEVGRFTPPFNGPYSMTKYAVEAYSDALRRELMFHDMQVSIIQPGAIKTNLLKKTPKVYDKYLEKSKFAKQIRKIYELSKKEWKKGAEPEEVAKVVYKALHAKRPKIRYKIKNDKPRMMLEKLPVKLTDQLIKIILK